MRTTIDLPDPLFKKVKARAALDGLKLREFIARAVETALHTKGKSPVAAKKFKPLPVIKTKGKGGPLLKILSNKRINELQLEEDIERYRKSFGC